jgi:hypothetical protein
MWERNGLGSGDSYKDMLDYSGLLYDEESEPETILTTRIILSTL